MESGVLTCPSRAAVTKTLSPAYGMNLAYSNVNDNPLYEMSMTVCVHIVNTHKHLESNTNHPKQEYSDCYVYYTDIYCEHLTTYIPVGEVG